MAPIACVHFLLVVRACMLVTEEMLTGKRAHSHFDVSEKKLRFFGKNRSRHSPCCSICDKEEGLNLNKTLAAFYAIIYWGGGGLSLQHPHVIGSRRRPSFKVIGVMIDFIDPSPLHGPTRTRKKVCRTSAIKLEEFQNAIVFAGGGVTEMPQRCHHHCRLGCEHSINVLGVNYRSFLDAQFVQESNHYQTLG